MYEPNRAPNKEAAGNAGEALLIQYGELIINRELEISLRTSVRMEIKRHGTVPLFGRTLKPSEACLAPRACCMRHVNN